MADLERKVVLVTRKTRLEELVMRFNTVSQAKFYIEHLGADFADLERETATYRAALALVEEGSRRFCRLQVLERAYLPTFLFGPQDIVIALGQDGLIANTMKYLHGQPLIGINPDTHRFDGVLLPFEPRDTGPVLEDVLADRRATRRVTMARVVLSDGQELHAVNDLFVGPRSHTSARYELEFQGKTETQSSSGVIVSTGLGSTAWYRSIVTGSCAVASSLGFRGGQGGYQPLAWDAPRLRFAVREPFPSVASGTAIVCGEIRNETSLKLRSLMPENGVIFSDGIEHDFLAFNSGTLATVGVAERSGQLIQ